MSQTSDTSQQTVPTCALGLTSADLSAWRDETLAPDETARIGAHSASCPACQRRLQGFEAIAATLQGQQVPAPDGRLWQAVLAALYTDQWTANADSITRETLVPDEPSDENPLPQSPTPSRSWRRRALGTLAAVAAIALVVVGFGRLFQFGAQNRPSQTFSLTWRQVTLPTDLSTQNKGRMSLNISPADGSIAWICQPEVTNPSPTNLRIWRTTDGGATWKRIAAPQVGTVAACQMNLDQLDSNIAILNLVLATRPNSQTTPSAYITFDGGAHWQPSTLPDGEMATLNGATYLLTGYFSMLEVSTDGLKTWRRLDDPLSSQKLQADGFLVNPATGELLVRVVSMQNSRDISLWTTDAAGSDWQRIATPPSISPNFAASPTSDGQHWNICALVFGNNTDPQHLDFTSHVYCGTEQSTTWRKLPGLDFSRYTNAYCPSCADPRANPYGIIDLLGIANDGALLATAQDRFDANLQVTRTSLYRLPAGSSRWQYSGALPKSGVRFMRHPGGGIFWSMPSENGMSDTTGPLFTADYPGPATQPLPTQSQQTPTPAGNVTQGAPLAWQPIATPAGFQPRLTSANILAVAPSDGRTAYACAQPNADPPATQPHGWVTHDGGASWSSLPLPQVTGWCSLVVDEVNPRDVLLGIAQDPLAGGSTLPDSYYRSTDGGATWQHIPGLDGSMVYQFATYGSAIYALRVTNPLSDTATAELQVSADGMATWHAVDGGLHSGQSGVGQFWLNPYNGALLATNVPPSNVTTTSTTAVWRSSDGGAHWSDLKAPAYGFTSVIVRPPQPNQAWDICVSDFTASPTTAPSNLLYCGDDSGQGWHEMTGLDTGDTTATPRYIAFTSDGALLAINMAATSSGATTYNVYRLPSGANRWQALGPTPEFSLLYAPTADGDGMLWSVPANGIVGVPENGISSDAQGRIFAVAAP